MTGTTHVVQQGEHLAGIARRHGFADHRAIWDHPRNADLRRRRRNPNVLLPGDALFIPGKQPRTARCPTAASHRFQLTGGALKLRIVLRDFDGRPLTGCACVLRIEGGSREARTGGDGMFEVEIPPGARHGTLAVPDLGLQVPVRIGDLDPADSDTGWRGRLVNLGYHPGPHDADDALLRRALEEFQCDHGLPVTGSPDAATRARLQEVHGC